MITAFELAGFFAAHAVWSVSDGATLIPILAYTGENDQREMVRLPSNDLVAAVELGKQKLASNAMKASDAVLIYDGRIAMGGEKLDALIIEVRAYFSPDSEAMLAVPYTPESSGQFRVHKPKLLAWENCEDFETEAALVAFFNGIAAHEKGSEIWNRCIDESK